MIDLNVPAEEEEIEFLFRDKEHPGEARTVELRSMADEILTTYYDVVLSGLNEALRSGEISTIMNMPVLSESIRLFHVSDVQFYNVSRTDMLADIQLWVTVRTNVEEETDAELGATLSFSFEDRIAVEYVSSWARTDPPGRERYLRLDAMGALYCSSGTGEKRSDEIWRTWHVPGLTDQTERDPIILAEKQGIAVDRTRQIPGLKSVLCFKGAEVTVLAAGGTGKKMETLCLEQDTLFLGVDSSGAIQTGKLDLFMHCVNYAWYYKFYRFQGLSCDDLTQMQTRWMPEEKARESAKVMGCVQSMSRRMAYSLMLPKEYLESSVARIYHAAAARPRPLGYHMSAGFILSEIGKILHGENQGITYRNFRTRFIQIGYKEAFGIYNPTDFHSTDPYGFSDESLMSGNYTLSIGKREDLLRLFHRDKEFRQVMESGDFVFADGLVARNHRDYVMDTLYGCRLTPDANDQADVCCLRFSTRWNPASNHMQISFGRKNLEWMKVTLERTVGEVYQEERKVSLQEQMERLLNLKGFHKAFSDLVHTRTSAEKLAAASTIPLRRVLELMQSEQDTYIRDELLFLCLGMRLEPPLSLTLFRKAGIALPEEDPDYRRAILCCLFRDSVTELRRWQAETEKNRIGLQIPYFSLNAEWRAK